MPRALVLSKFLHLLGGIALSTISATQAMAQEVNLYTTREPGLIKPLLDAFTARSGVKVNAVFVKDGLPERVATEGAGSPADVLMTVDIGNLVDLVAKGVTQPIQSAIVNEAVPPNLRDENGHWYALSLRARILYASKERTAIKTFRYEDFADPKYKGKVCVRSGQHPYNTALVAAMIARDGEAKAEAWLRAVKANLGRRAAGGDREVAKDILAGTCDIGIANSYYIGLMTSGKGGPDQQKWAEGVTAILPVFDGGGTHVNASGAAIAKNAPNKANAIKLVEYLVSDEAQGMYGSVNYEFPVKKGAKIDPIIAALGDLKPDSVSLTDIVKNRKKASELADKVGFDASS